MTGGAERIARAGAEADAKAGADADVHPRPAAALGRRVRVAAARASLVICLSGAVAFVPSPARAEPATAPAASAAADDSAVPKVEEAGIWIGTAAVVCLEQDAALKATAFGRQLVQSPAYGAWHAEQKPAVLACLAQKRFLPPAVCTDIFAQDPENHDDHSRALYERHASGIAHLSRLDECTAL